jgi:hypothetical protein
MALNGLNFSKKNSVGNFSRSSAREALDENFKGLSNRAKEYLAEKMGKSGTNLDASEFNNMLDGAHKNGLISNMEAEKIREKSELSSDLGKNII